MKKAFPVVIIPTELINMLQKLLICTHEKDSDPSHCGTFVVGLSVKVNGQKNG